MKKVIGDKKYDEIVAKAKHGTYTTTAWTVLNIMQEPTGRDDLDKYNYIVVENAYVSLVLYFDGKQLVECVRELDEEDEE
jgi:hypothetical protein